MIPILRVQTDIKVHVLGLFVVFYNEKLHD